MNVVIAGLVSLLLLCRWQPAEASPSSVAFVGFDALGMDSERVLRLETLFLKELERMTGRPVPNRWSVAKLNRKLRKCDGQNTCLAAIGKALRVEIVVSGNVAELGDSFVLNIKAVTTSTKTELRRIKSPPLRGKPEQLIEAIRVSAYQLLSPEALHGSILLLADREGAMVTLDGQSIGKTPLASPINGLPLGEHTLRVDAGDFGSFDSKVVVRFQKTTRVAVHLVDLRIKAKEGPARQELVVIHKAADKGWYQKTWFLVSVGVGAVIVAGYLGYTLTGDQSIDCTDAMDKCSP